MFIILMPGFTIFSQIQISLLEILKNLSRFCRKFSKKAFENIFKKWTI